MGKSTWFVALSLWTIGCAGQAPLPSAIEETPAAAGGAITTASTLAVVAPSSVVRGSDKLISATVVDDNGRSLDVTHLVTWSSSNVLVLAVGDGHLYSVGAGTATVRATLGEETTSFDVTVVPRVVGSLTIMADGESAVIGETRTWSALALYNDGSVADVTADAVWDAADDTIATIAAPGRVRAQSAGMTTISVTFGGQTSTAPFLVQ